ncbi:MAG TPA: type II secretion system protein E [Agrobacterium sp.]|nr:type II secretion system protein E [Agrobacterium sp.]
MSDKVALYDAPQAPSKAPRGAGQPKLGDILVERGVVTTAQVAEAARLQEQTGKRMGLIMVEKKWLTEAALFQALAEQLDLPFVSLRAGLYDPVAVSLLERDVAKRLNVIPLFVVENTLTLATGEPQAVHSIDEIRARTGCRIRVAMAPPADINRVRDDAYGGTMPDFIHSEANDLELVDSQIPDDYTQIDQMAGASPVINMVNAVIQRAIHDNASDIHIEISRNKSRIRLRIDGILYEVMSPRVELHPAIVSRLKVMAHLDIAERRLPQDGRIQVMTQGRTVDLRFSSLPGIYGEKVVLRVLDKNQSILDVDKLGMERGTVETFKRLLGRSHGLILVTGPTGSGKTTSLYAAINYLKSIEKNIVTIEDPVEYQLDIINQNQVNDAIGLTFPKILKHVLRQDPDIIMVGEIRDLATAEMAIQAALTGHLVLSTLHTNDAPSAIMRLLELGVPDYLLEATMIGVMAQRLVRTLCSECKAPDGELNDDVWQSIGGAWNLPKPETVYRPIGCPECRQTGYRGRTGLYELLTVSEEFTQLIGASTDLQALRQQSVADGMKPLRIAGAMKIMEGVTTAEEVLKVTSALSGG